MKFKRSTQILFAVALAMATGVAVYEGTLVPERQTQELKQKKVFSFTEDRVKSILLTTPDRTIKFDRLPPVLNRSTSSWQLTLLNSTQKSELKDTQPQPANEAYVSFLLGLLVNAQSDREIPIAVDKKSEYGLDRPQATIEVQLENDRLYTLVLGGRDFSDTFLYAIANPTTDTTKTLSVLLVSSNFENGVKRSLAEWKLQPEKPTSEQPKTDKSKLGQPKPEQLSPERSETKPVNSEPKKNEPSKPENPAPSSEVQPEEPDTNSLESTPSVQSSPKPSDGNSL